MKLKRFISAALSGVLLTSSLSLNVCYAGETADLSTSGENTVVSGAGVELTPYGPSYSSKDKKYPVEGGNLYYNISGASGVITGCDSNVTSADIPSEIDGVKITSIKESAFKYNRGLASLTIPDSITSIGADAFFGCSGLTSLTIPDSVTSIGANAFKDCTGLISVTISEGVTSMGESAFYNCSGLASVTIPSSLTNIKNNTFYKCSGLVSVTIPDSVTSIGTYAFYGCKSLSGLTLPDSVTNIGANAFEGCRSIASVAIPNSVTNINNSVFSGCSGLTSISIPSSVISIGENAFYKCSSLAEVTLPKNVLSVGSDAFYYCSSLRSLTVLNSATSIADAFRLCSNIKTVYCHKNSTADNSSLYHTYSSPAFVYFESLSDEEGSAQSIYAGEGVILFADSTIKTADIPYSSGIKEIAPGAFSYCFELTRVTITGGVKTIAEDAFTSCGSLTIVCDIGSAAEKFAAEHNIPYEVMEPEYGDADMDDKLTASDAASILQKVLNDAYVPTIQDRTGDMAANYLRVTRDSEAITASDAAAVLQKVLSSEYTMPCEKQETTGA